MASHGCSVIWPNCPYKEEAGESSVSSCQIKESFHIEIPSFLRALPTCVFPLCVPCCGLLGQLDFDPQASFHSNLSFLLGVRFAVPCQPQL